MATPSSRSELADYCKRQLGAPVLEINIADEQVEDILDDAKKDACGGTTTAELGEKDTSSTSSTVSDVSSKATYEEVPAGTVILEKPQRSDFKGRSGAAQFKKAMMMYNNQKDMLNSYQKTQMKASLAKI